MYKKIRNTGRTSQFSSSWI